MSLDPNLSGVALGGEPLALLAERVLVDGDDLPVRQDLLGLDRNAPEVDSQDSKDAPDRELRPLLLVGAASCSCR